MEPLNGVFHNAETGETVYRELTTEEIAALQQASNDLATEPPT